MTPVQRIGEINLGDGTVLVVTAIAGEVRVVGWRRDCSGEWRQTRDQLRLPAGVCSDLGWLLWDATASPQALVVPPNCAGWGHA